MYKATPKRVKEEKGIDRIIEDPTGYVQSRRRGCGCGCGRGRKRSKDAEQVNLEEVGAAIGQFIDYAYQQYYLAPNRYVHKRERPKWRFTVKRFYKALTSVTAPPEAVERAGELLGKLYEVLCFGCAYRIFSSDDPFRSVGIDQTKFFQQTLRMMAEVLDTEAFIEYAITMLVKSELDLETLSVDLIAMILPFLETDAMKRTAIARSEKLKGEIPSILRVASGSDTACITEYQYKKRKRWLVEFAFECYHALGDEREGCRYFIANLDESNPEVTLFILLRRLRRMGETERWCEEYEAALARYRAAELVKAHL